MARIRRRLAWSAAIAALAFGSRGDAPPDVPSAAPIYWRVIPAVRGRILDSAGRPLAEQRRAFDIYVLPALFEPEVRARLIGLLGLSQAEAADLDRRVARAEPVRAVLALPDQDRERADLVAAAGGELGGAVLVRDDSLRVHRQGETAAHLIGTVGGDPAVGRSGIEQAMEKALHGEEGSERLDGLLYAPPVAGNDVVLTIDLALQRAAEDALAGYPAGAALMVEVQTGRILAMVSIPSFDPDAVNESLPIDRDIAQAYPPASTFKLVTALAGLDSGVIDIDDTVTCTGSRTVGKRVLRDMGVHGTVNFLAAVQQSCNVYFWSVAEKVGLDRLRAVARDVGFGAETGLGLDGEVPGQVVASSRRASDDLTLTLNTAVGSADVRVTPLQLAMAYAALANGGRLYAPQLVRRVQTSLGQVLEEREPLVRRTLAASPAALALLREGMRRAVNQPNGTAFSAHKGRVTMAGKTGTTEVTRPAAFPHAWFAGWAPADRPQIAVVVLVENGGVGGLVAAPIARAIVDAWAARGVRHRRR